MSLNHTSFFVMRRLWGTMALLLGLLIFTGAFRGLWGWSHDLRHERTVNLIQADMIKWKQVAAISVWEQSETISELEDASRVAKDVYDKWPRVKDVNGNNILVIDTEWGLYRPENKGSDGAAEREARLGRKFKDPVPDQVVYITECMALISELEAGMSLPAYSPKSFSGYELRYLFRLLTDLSWRLLRQIETAGSPTVRLDYALQLLRVFDLKRQCSHLFGFDTFGAWISAHGVRQERNKLIPMRLSKMPAELWRDGQVQDWIKKEITRLMNVHLNDANLHYHLVNEYERLSVNDGSTIEMLNDMFIKGELYALPLYKRDQRIQLKEFHACLQYLVHGGYPVNWQSPYYPTDEALDELNLSLRESIDDNLRQSVHAQLSLYSRFQLLREFTATYLAMKLYELDHGEKPAELKALLPDYLPRLPVDYLDAKHHPLQYVPDRQLLYSVENGLEYGVMRRGHAAKSR